jgi:flavin-dependent dehydrogenase
MTTSNLSERIQALDPGKRDLLAKALRQRMHGHDHEPEITHRQPADPPSATFDVVILGGGLAGQTLARQIQLERPETRILVTELRRHPAKESAHKVGESTVEIGANYLGKRLGLEPYLLEAQLRKSGLRYFFSDGANDDIAARVEMGASYFPPVPSYQLDRGRLENFLAEDNVRNGVAFWDGTKALEVTRDSDMHFISLERDGESSCIATRWVVDATGRAGLLKRQLGLQRESSHKCNAVWFRIADRIDIDEWSDTPEWRERIPMGLRWFSTNHLLGRGYWVWLIPLATGATSIGVVADPALHPLEEMRSFDRALDWLHRYEPQCAREVEKRRDKKLDFLAIKHYAYGCERVFSGDRWALTGEAGVFTDPFYSPGSDFIGMSNTFIADLILRDFKGEDIRRRANDYNRVYLNTYESFISIYENQYPLMGNGPLMAAKIVWDFAIYWGFLTIQFLGGRLCDLDLLERAGTVLQRVNHLNARMQAFFREWDALESSACEAKFIDVLGVDIMRRLHYGLQDDLPGDALLERFRENLKLCESLAAAIFHEASRSLPGAPVPDPMHGLVNPYAITFNQDGKEELLDPGKAVAVEEVASGSIEKMRLNRRSPAAEQPLSADEVYAG